MGGPVETSMVVFGDIWSYKSGVYTCGTKKGGSGHSVVIIGWGKENGTVPYWLVKNSWGPHCACARSLSYPAYTVSPPPLPLLPPTLALLLPTVRASRALLQGGWTDFSK